MKKIIIAIVVCTIFLQVTKYVYAALPSSANFQLKGYSFGSGGASATSASYGLSGIAGEVEFGRPTSANYEAGTGLNYILKLHVPPSPTLSNPGPATYDRLQIVINQGNNASDVLYAIAISTSSTFSSNVSYVKSDMTVGNSLTIADYKTYTGWGGASGFYVTTLAANTTYYVRARARVGSNGYTETEWGPISTGVTTLLPSLTFGINSDTVIFNNLNAGNSYTDSTKTTVLTTSTNAYNGYVINARETGPLTAGTFSISDYGSPNSAPTTWSGTGFGYTTNDNSLTGGTANRFTNSGPNYAGFTTASPGDPVADHAGPVITNIVNEPFTITYRVTASSTQAAKKYTTTVLYVVVPQY